LFCLIFHDYHCMTNAFIVCQRAPHTAPVLVVTRSGAKLQNPARCPLNASSCGACHEP
jgi:hypothetical protein